MKKTTEILANVSISFSVMTLSVHEEVRGVFLYSSHKFGDASLANQPYVLR
jgi:hypothetical protein